MQLIGFRIIELEFSNNEKNLEKNTGKTLATQGTLVSFE